MLFLTASMIKEAEKRTLENVSSMTLIENAAYALFNELKSFSSVRIYCGKGNNGSDGYATAILLKKSGIQTEIVQVAPPQTDECRFLYQKALQEDIRIIDEVDFPQENFECILDAVLGIGITGDVIDPPIRKAIGIINTSGSFVVSADIPSGMNTDTGKECGIAVRADKTVTFTAPKLGMLSNSSVDLCGEIKVAEVGIGVNYTEFSESTCVPITPKLIKAMLPKRSRYSHKGTFGTTVIVAGSSTMPGAAVMAAMAAVRSGCGLVKVIVPVSICRVLNILVKEAIVIPVPEQNGIMLPDLTPEAFAAIKEADSVLVGCGLGKGNHHILINNILSNASCGVIVDADGINSLHENMGTIRNKNVLITPHPKEFSRISGYEVKEIESNRITLSDSFARENGINLLLKGARSIITYGGSNRYVSIESTSALAKAGSGDILAGLIAGIASQGLVLTDSAATACLIHTHTGIIAEKEIGAFGATADDLISFIPRAIKQIQNYI